VGAQRLKLLADQVEQLCHHCATAANARAVFVADGHGQILGAGGETAVGDGALVRAMLQGARGATTSLAGGLDEESHILIEPWGELRLVVAFDQRTSLGVARLRLRELREALDRLNLDAGPIPPGGAGSGSGGAPMDASLAQPPAATEPTGRN
jgi:hypothetical protein